MDRFRLHCPISGEPEPGRSFSLFVESLTLFWRRRGPETELYLFDPKA